MRGLGWEPRQTIRDGVMTVASPLTLGTGVPRLDAAKRIGLGYAFAGGLMVAASVYNLLMPALALGHDGATHLRPVLETLGGMALGAAFLSWVERAMTPARLASGWLRPLGGRVASSGRK